MVWRVGRIGRRYPLVLAQADFRQNALPDNVTFSRASGGSYFNSAGDFVEVSVDTPRFDHDPITLAPLGLLVETFDENKIPNPRLIGATVGQVGVGGSLPDTWLLGGSPPVNVFVESLGSSAGIPYIDIKFQGVTATSGQAQIYTNRLAGLTWNCFVGETYTYSIFMRMLPGSSMNGITAVNNMLAERDASNNFLTAHTFPVESLTSTNLRVSRQSVTFTVSNVNARKINSSIRVEFAAGANVNLTLRVALPQGEPGTTASSVILPPSGTVALSTRAADVVALSATNGMYDVLVQDTEGGEWRPDEVVTGGAYIITPRSGKRQVRRVRLYPQGTAVMYPGWAVAA